MARTIILRTKDDSKIWLVDLDRKAISEIDNDAIGDEQALIQEADVITAAATRTITASHALFDA